MDEGGGQHDTPSLPSGCLLGQTVDGALQLDEVHQAVDEVLQGRLWVPPGMDLAESDTEASDLLRRLKSLTPQQSRVLGMLGEGLLNKQIAYELGVSEATIKAHVSAILLKLNVDSRTQAVIQLSKIGTVAAA